MLIDDIIEEMKKRYPNDVVLLDDKDETEVRVHIACVKLIEEIADLAERGLDE